MRKGEVKTIELTGQNVLAMRDAQSAQAAGATQVRVCERCVITPSARDFLRQNEIELVMGPGAVVAASTSRSAASPVQATRSPANPRLFSTPEAEAMKKEICAVGRKLWMREFVDGNGGNISYRIGPNEVLCTPTLVSKLRPDARRPVHGRSGRQPDCGKQAAHQRNPPASGNLQGCAGGQGLRPLPSASCHRLRHHRARAAQSGHPGVRSLRRQGGHLALRNARHGEFAQTVLPYVKTHNTVLLANHGIICWADTVTHAEWYAEVLETYCWTLMLAAQLGAPISHISEQQATDLLAIKKKLGLPDSRFDPAAMKECQLSDMDDPNSIARLPCVRDGATRITADAPEIDRLVKMVTDAVMSAMGES